MKIFAMINNNTTSKESVSYYTMPDSCMYPSRKPFFVPDFDDDFRLYPSLVVRIDKLGKSVAARFANRYYDHCSFGFAVRACSLYRDLQQKGLPVDPAVSFDCSAIVGPMMPLEQFSSLPYLPFDVYLNGEKRLTVSRETDRMDIGKVIETVSRHNTLKTGDLVFTALSAEGISAKENDLITIRTNIINELTIKIK